MSDLKKWLAASAVGMLVALGLCGLSTALSMNTGLSTLGLVAFGLFVVCGLSLLGSLFALAVHLLFDKTGKRP